MRYLTHEGQDTYWQSTGADTNVSTGTMVTPSNSTTLVQGQAMNGTPPSSVELAVEHRKSALEKDDAEVASTEKRAKRIGYQVSTV